MIQLQISLEYSFEYLSLKSIANCFHYLNCHSISQIPTVIITSQQQICFMK